jgi:very-short-patch-repair endonuclease
VTRNQIELRLATGRLHEIHRGVYLVGHEVPPPYAPEMAALLACRTDAVLSHTSAASLWRLLPYPAADDVCVTVPPTRYLTRPNLEVHRAELHPRDTRHRHRLALTSPPRTILDLAGSLDLERLESLVAEANYRRLAGDAELRDQLARNRGKRGIGRLRTVLDLPGGARRTRSPAEREMLALIRRAGLTGYETNAQIHGYEVDVLWSDARLAVEVDGYAAHSGRVAFERDRLKNAALTAHGLTVMYVTGRQIRRDPDGVLDRVLGALAEAR